MKPVSVSTEVAEMGFAAITCAMGGDVNPNPIVTEAVRKDQVGTLATVLAVLAAKAVEDAAEMMGSDPEVVLQRWAARSYLSGSNG